MTFQTDLNTHQKWLILDILLHFYQYIIQIRERNIQPSVRYLKRCVNFLLSIFLSWHAHTTLEICVYVDLCCNSESDN